MNQSNLARTLLIIAGVYLGMTDRALAESPAKVRKFTFHYRFRVKGLNAADREGKLVKVWMPRASDSDGQKITMLPAIAPADVSEHTESRFQNRILFFQTSVPETGEFTVDVPYDVVRHEVLRGPDSKDQSVDKLDDVKRKLYLSPDQLVPTTGKPLTLLKDVPLRKDRLAVARQLYDIVDDHVTYKKEGTEWGRGDSNWVCDSRFGNCTDFHSLFISLARSQNLPARFEIGFSIPTDQHEGKIAGYHCWAWFYLDGRGWMPVDISEADKHPEMKDYYFGNLTADRVMFSTGRDLELVPKSGTAPLNFFLYPQIEIGGEKISADNLEMQCTFKDMH